jgi:flagellar protein FlbT
MLRITLADGEKAIINGAVLRAVGRTQICVENQVAILRGREVMRPEEATTPARQLYFAAMLAYIDPDGRIAHQDAIVDLLAAVLAATDRSDLQSACIHFAHEIARGDHYRALAACREIIAIETSLHPASDAA